MTPPSSKAVIEPTTPSARDASSSSADNDDESPQRPFDIAARLGLDVFGQPDSPSASLMLTKTAETLHGLSQQLAELNLDEPSSVRCCCGSKTECPSSAARERWEAKLKLSGGTCRAPPGYTSDRRLTHGFRDWTRPAATLRGSGEEVQAPRAQLRTPAQGARRLVTPCREPRAREQHTHVQVCRSDALVRGTREGEYSCGRGCGVCARSHIALIRHDAHTAHPHKQILADAQRYVQATHSQSLTQQSLSHVRSELAKCRQTANAQTIALAASGGIEQRLAEAERRYEDTRDLQHAESRKLKEQLKWRTMAEDRIGEFSGPFWC